MNSDQIQHYLERFSHILRAEARVNGIELDLQPVHIEVLHYLKECNHYSNTPQGVTQFLGLTKGTVSQSIKILQSKQLLTKTDDANDKRIVHLHLTQQAWQLMQSSNPTAYIDSALEQLSLGEQHAILASLKQLLQAGQQFSSINSFGRCQNCGHKQQLKTGELFCALTQETLADEQTLLICKDHQAVVEPIKQQSFDL